MFLIFTLAAANAHAANADTHTAKQFFARFQQLGLQYDSAIAALYSDKARIKLKIRESDGRARLIELSGSKWKALLSRIMPIGEKRGDRSTFSNVRISVSGNTASVAAERYIEHNCFPDSDYTLTLERLANGSYTIVEERLEGPRNSCC